MAIRGEYLSINVTTAYWILKPWVLKEFCQWPLSFKGISGSGWNISDKVSTYLFLLWVKKILKGISEIFFPWTTVARSQTYATLRVTDQNMNQLWTSLSMVLIHWRKAPISLKISTLLLHHIFLQVFTKKWQLPFTLQTRWHDGGAEKQQLHISNWLFWDGNSHRCTVWLSYW